MSHIFSPPEEFGVSMEFFLHYKERSRLLSFTTLTLGVAAALAFVLGAQAPQVRRMVVLQGARVVSAGIAVGILIALWTTSALDSLLFGVEAIDAATFAAMSVVMIAIGLLASYVPARRASKVDPIVALQGE